MPGSAWGCSRDKTFAEAEAICQTAGARLCTVAEIGDGCTAGTGCSFDQALVWASKPAAPSPSPSPPPLPNAQKAPAVCGNPNDARCDETPGPKELDEPHEVRLQRIHPIARLRAC